MAVLRKNRLLAECYTANMYLERFLYTHFFKYKLFLL